MSRFTKLPGVTFSNPSLPVLQTYESQIEQIPGLKLWTRATDKFVATKASGEMVWENRVGTTHVRQTDAARQPVYTKSQVNGRAAMVFPGDAQVRSLIWDGETNVAEGAATTRVLIVKRNTANSAAWATPFLYSSNHASDGSISRNALYYRQSNGLIEFAIGTVVRTSAAADNNDQWGVIFASYVNHGDTVDGEMKLAVGAGAIAARTVPNINVTTASLASNLIIGGQTTGGANPWNGGMAEFLYAEVDLLSEGHAASRALLLEYAKRRYGI